MIPLYTCQACLWLLQNSSGSLFVVFLEKCWWWRGGDSFITLQMPSLSKGLNHEYQFSGLLPAFEACCDRSGSQQQPAGASSGPPLFDILDKVMLYNGTTICCNLKIWPPETSTQNLSWNELMENTVCASFVSCCTTCLYSLYNLPTIDTTISKCNYISNGPRPNNILDIWSYLA